VEFVRYVSPMFSPMTFRAVFSTLLSRGLAAGAGLVLLGSGVALAELRLPAVFSDHAMIQADKPIEVWGWAKPGAEVNVVLLPKEGKGAASAVKAGADGRWSVPLPPLKAGTAAEIEVRAQDEKPIKITDVLAGEVWLCSGQSNMSYLLTTKGRKPNESTGPEILAEAQKNATDAQGALRYFAVSAKRADIPLDDVTGHWVVATPESCGGCFALSWNFAVALHQRLHVPVGVINTAIGGTAIEPWTPRPELEECSVGPATIARYQAKLDSLKPEEKAKYESDLAAWTQRYPTPELQRQNLTTKPIPAEGNSNMPSRLYNGMVHGLEPYTLKGFLWFQGDGNFGNPHEYGALVQTLIRAWRSHFRDDTLPFYYVEMQNYRKPQEAPVEPNPMSLIREAQQGALQLPHTDVAASLDQGIDQPDYEAHFPNKKPLGQRMAGLALNNLYGQPGLVHSPAFKSWAVEAGGKVRIKLDHATGLRQRGTAGLRGFAIQSADSGWLWAQARIDGEDIVLWNEQVATPVAVRYAWAFNPLLSVENGAGLPLRPFRTDRESGE
jgi:sialate O-acetylesterase